MNGRGAAEIVGVVLFSVGELIATGLLLCVGWYLGSKILSRIEKKKIPGLRPARRTG